MKRPRSFMERLRKPAASIAAILGSVSVTACNVSAESLFPPSTSQSQKPNSTTSETSSSNESLQTENSQSGPLDLTATTDMTEEEYLGSPERFEALNNFLQQACRDVKKLEQEYGDYFKVSENGQAIIYDPAKLDDKYYDRFLPEFSLYVQTVADDCLSITIGSTNDISGETTEYRIKEDGDEIITIFSVTYQDGKTLNMDPGKDGDNGIATAIKTMIDTLRQYLEKFTTR